MKRFMVVIITSMVLFSLMACSVRVAIPSSTVLTSTASSPTLKIEVFISNLNIPWEMVFLPDGRILITERPGNIRIIKDGQLQTEPWMILDVAASGEGGLLGMALDPAFSANHYVYVAYTYKTAEGTLQNRLVRLHEDTATGKGELDKVLLDNVQAGSVHDGGRIKFGPDGKLYWTVGETGNPELAQDLSSPNGKILRINPDGTIPNDNPFVGSPIYSYGHRNPEGLAWQPGTGRLYSTEHGPSGGSYGVGQDEVNFIEPGKNYGWPVIIGKDTREGMISPIYQSGESKTWAPGGATFVTGGPWNGSMLFVGLRGEALYRLVLDTNDPHKVIIFEEYFTGHFGRLRDVVQGPDGSLYIVTNNRDGRGNPSQGDDKVLRLTFN